MANYNKKIQVKLNEVDPEPVEIIASAILDISKAMRHIESTRLTRNAIVALIKDRSGLNKGVIEIVLNNLEGLEKNYLKPKKVRP